MEKAKLTQSQLKTIECIIKSNSIEQASKRAKVSRATIYVWLKQDRFRESLQKERDAVFNEALDLLKQATRRAVEELVSLLQSKDEKTRRLVAREIIAQAMRISEIRDLEERISKIEHIVEYDKSHRN